MTKLTTLRREAEAKKAYDEQYGNLDYPKDYQTILKLITALEKAIEQRNYKGCMECHISGETAEFNAEISKILEGTP